MDSNPWVRINTGPTLGRIEVTLTQEAIAALADLSADQLTAVMAVLEAEHLNTFVVMSREGFKPEAVAPLANEREGIKRAMKGLVTAVEKSKKFIHGGRE